MEISIDTREGAAAKLLFCGWKPYPSAYSEQIDQLIASGRFKPEAAKIKTIESGKSFLFLMGKPKEEDVRHLRQLIGKAVRAAREENIKTIEFDLDSYHGPMPLWLVVRCLTQAAWEANYSFDDYLTEKDDTKLEKATIYYTGVVTEEILHAFEEGKLIGEAVCNARGVINRTSRDITPQKLVDWVVAGAKGKPYECEVLDEGALREENATALLSVSAGSLNPPSMVILRYQGDAAHKEQITAIVGKGITFDSGGLSLKSKTGMITMHHDMGGAAATAVAFDVIARMEIKVNLTAILPICENMLSPLSYRPGDVIGTMNGKTVLIKSTDAEGRLVLADAITYALRREKATRLIDIATLTGGAVSSFGPLINAIAVEDDALRTAVNKASQASGELVWEMPLLADYKSFLATEHADIANSSNGAGSSMINAAIFLKEFTQSVPWLHIDSAGTSWTTKSEGCFSYGATGAGTALLYDLIKNIAKA